MILFNPWFWLFLVASCLGSVFAGYEYAENGIAAERAAAQAALQAANKHAEDVTATWQAKNSDITNQLKKAQDELDKTNHTLNTSLANGTVRLSIAGSCGGAVSGDTTPASGDNAGTCNIDPGAAQALVALTERGDKAIEKLNACVAAYNTLLEPK